MDGPNRQSTCRSLSRYLSQSRSDSHRTDHGNPRDKRSGQDHAPLVRGWYQPPPPARNLLPLPLASCVFHSPAVPGPSACRGHFPRSRAPVMLWLFLSGDSRRCRTRLRRRFSGPFLHFPFFSIAGFVFSPPPVSFDPVILSKWAQRGKNRGQVRHEFNIFPKTITFLCHLVGGGCYFGIKPCLK